MLGSSSTIATIFGRISMSYWLLSHQAKLADRGGFQGPTYIYDRIAGRRDLPLRQVCKNTPHPWGLHDRRRILAFENGRRATKTMSKHQSPVGSWPLCVASISAAIQAARQSPASGIDPIGSMDVAAVSSSTPAKTTGIPGRRNMTPRGARITLAQ